MKSTFKNCPKAYSNILIKSLQCQQSGGRGELCEFEGSRSTKRVQGRTDNIQGYTKNTCLKKKKNI